MNKNKKRESTDDLDHSRYLKQSDCEDGLQGRIKMVVRENVAPQGAEPELGYVVLFDDIKKSLVLNKIKGAQIATIAGSKYFEDWPGTVIEMYQDKTITCGGKITGGIRVRCPRVEPAPHRPAKISEPTSDDPDEDALNAELAAVTNG